MTAKKKAASLSKPPVQVRSHQSLERMLEATETVLKNKISDDFTLKEVCLAGDVSIGSIYNRFGCKKSLLKAVQARALSRIEFKLENTINSSYNDSENISEYLEKSVFGIFSVFRENSAIMRALISAARHDESLLSRGVEYYESMRETFINRLSQYQDDVRLPNSDAAIKSVFEIMYSIIDRCLGLNSPSASGDASDWDSILNDFIQMSVRYLLDGSNK